MDINLAASRSSPESKAAFSLIKYFRAEEIERSLPSLLVKKLIDIVNDYFKLQPQLTKKED